MTTQIFELQAVTNKELFGVTGGHASPFTHKPFIGALQNLQVNDQADRDGSIKLQSLHSVATMG